MKNSKIFINRPENFFKKSNPFKKQIFLKGFTLIEMLVAITIIIILAGIVIPSFQGAKEKANRVICMNNLKQLGYGFGMYVTEYGGKWPPYLFTFSPGNSGKWVVLVVPKRKSASLVQGSREKGLYVCPSDTSPMKITVNEDQDPAYHGPPVNEEMEISYSYNLMLYTEGIEYYDLAHPDQTVVLFDGRQLIEHQGQWKSDPDFYENVLENRHNGGANHLFADFHVEWKPDITDENIIPRPW
ncbi:MAG: prepilin-type N-terminal cleavage/methylation domain-containing protein [bacterium]|nr:prepilin-type N-terminal cleavage/methylation domain-containing protein [bacterium]